MAKGSGGTRNTQNGGGGTLTPLNISEINDLRSRISRNDSVSGTIKGDGIRYSIYTQARENQHVAIISYRIPGNSNDRYLDDIYASSKHELSTKVIGAIKRHYNN